MSVENLTVANSLPTESSNGDMISAAETLLHQLAALGVEYIFVNPGTDYPPVIEAIAKSKSEGATIPIAVICPHENAAMGMAHGYYFASGKSQSVMVHTNVGLANTICALINAASDNVPTLLFSGRTPISERGRLGSRDTPIGYGQEMRDQAALVRESVKWDYELREPEQMPELVERAYAVANSLPKGPVYVSLPREPLSLPYPRSQVMLPAVLAPAAYGPTRAAIAQAAKLIVAAKAPVIFAQRGAGSIEGFQILSELANEWGIPVVEYWATQIGISSDDPMAAGNEPSPWLEEADLVIIVDSLAPWMISQHTIGRDCNVIQIGPDPLFERTPIRSYRSDVALCGDVAEALRALLDAVSGRAGAGVVDRREVVANKNAIAKTTRAAIALAGSTTRISKPWLSHCMGVIAEKYDGKIVSELVTLLEFTGLTRPNTYYQEALAGGLGNAFPIALGMQLADRERLIIAAMGDGSYRFSNPLVCHQIAEAMKLPVLIVIGNNKVWGAVRAATLGIYPHGYASKMQVMPATELSHEPGPDFVDVAKAMHARASWVDDGQQLISELESAVEFIRSERRAALVEVAIG
jgi:acetolactate synthase-1/2/3 large subunit